MFVIWKRWKNEENHLHLLQCNAGIQQKNEKAQKIPLDEKNMLGQYIISLDQKH